MTIIKKLCKLNYRTIIRIIINLIIIKLLQKIHSKNEKSIK